MILFLVEPAGNKLATLLLAEDIAFPYLVLAMDRSERGWLMRVSRSGGDHGWPVSSFDANPLNRPLRYTKKYM
jgi:LPS sulfotransferase NodH